MQNDAFPITLPRKGQQAIRLEDREVVKRDGRTLPWDAAKITRAIALAFYNVRHNGALNPHRDDPSAQYGLDGEDFLKAVAITQRVSQILELSYLDGRFPHIEEIQDAVEKAIAAEGEWEVAKAYILYRRKKADLRILRHKENGLSDYIAVSKYARYRADLGRRETFGEATDRVRDMHIGKIGKEKSKIDLTGLLSEVRDKTIDSEVWDELKKMVSGKNFGDSIREALDAVANKKVLPSMRSLQFGGEAILAANARMFNCSFSAIDRIEFFREYLYLLLAGCGCGFSVQKHHVNRLPTFTRRAQSMNMQMNHF